MRVFDGYGSPSKVYAYGWVRGPTGRRKRGWVLLFLASLCDDVPRPDIFDRRVSRADLRVVKRRGSARVRIATSNTGS